MIPSSFTQGVWGKSWEGARGDNAVQGTASLGDEGVVLDIPCGKLLGSPSVVINGEKSSLLRSTYTGSLKTGMRWCLETLRTVAVKRAIREWSIRPSVQIILWQQRDAVNLTRLT